MEASKPTTEGADPFRDPIPANAPPAATPRPVTST